MAEDKELLEAVENKLDFLVELATGYNPKSENESSSEEMINARKDLKNYLPKINSEVAQIIRHYFEGDPSVGLPESSLESFDDDELDEFNEILDEIFAKYDLAKYFIQLNENTTCDVAGIPQPIKKNNKLVEQVNILKESEGGTFKYTYKLDKTWFEKFKKENPEYEYYYDKVDRIYMVYDNDEHILTFNTTSNKVFSNALPETLLENYLTQDLIKELKENLESLLKTKVFLV